MAFYNEIGAGRFNRFLQKLFQIKGPPPSRQLATDVISQIQMDEGRVLEHRPLLSIRSFARSITVAAGGAGNKSGYRLRNPVGSNVIVTLEKVACASIAADQPFVTRGPTGTADFATSDAGNQSIRDLRLGAINSVLVASSITNTG